MAGFVLHSTATSSPAPAPAPGPSSALPVAHAAPLGGDAVVLDGRADEDAWKHAPAVEWETDFAGAPTGIHTRARFLHAPSGLYALWELEGAGLHTDRSRPTDVPRAKLYEEDCVELFFAPDPGHPRHYFETELGPFGHHLDVEVDLAAHRSDTGWSSDLRVATTQDAAGRRATIEAQLTAAPFRPPAVSPGASIRIGLYRMEGTAPRQFLAWSPPRTAKPDFHVPEAFGTLVVDP
jgi:hypothetical protein